MKTIVAVDVHHADGPSEPTRYFDSMELAREIIPPNLGGWISVIYTTIPVYDWSDSWHDLWKGREKQKEQFIADRVRRGRA